MTCKKRKTVVSYLLNKMLLKLHLIQLVPNAALEIYRKYVFFGKQKGLYVRDHPTVFFRTANRSSVSNPFCPGFYFIYLATSLQLNNSDFILFFRAKHVQQKDVHSLLFQPVSTKIVSRLFSGGRIHFITLKVLQTSL